MKKLSFRISPELAEQIDELARDESLPRSKMIEILIREALRARFPFAEYATGIPEAPPDPALRFD
jgi:predicted transcriptional regulator